MYGNKFKIITHSYAFQKTVDKKELITKVARWELFLQASDYAIICRRGNSMKYADVLSRYHVMIVTHDDVTWVIVALWILNNNKENFEK